jgi:hypothetical protein
LPYIYAFSTSDIKCKRDKSCDHQKVLVPDGQESDLQLILHEIQQQNGNDVVMNEAVVATKRDVLSKHKMMIKILGFPVNIM